MAYSPQEAQGYLDTHPAFKAQVEQRARELATELPARYLASIREQLEEAHQDELLFKAELATGCGSWPQHVGRLEGHLRSIRTYVECLSDALEKQPEPQTRRRDT